MAWVHAVAAGERGRQLRRFEAMMTGSIDAAQRWQTVERIRAHT